MEASCRLGGLQPSGLWKDSSEGAEEIDVGRRFHSESGPLSFFSRSSMSSVVDGRVCRLVVLSQPQYCNLTAVQASANFS